MDKSEKNRPGDQVWEDEKGIKQKIREEARKFASMDRKGKLSYFRSYYLLPCIVILAVLILAGTMVRDMIRGSGEVLISGMMLNTSLSDEGMEYLDAGYIEYLGRSGEKVHVHNSSYMLDLDGSGSFSVSYQTQMAVVTQLAAGGLDFVLADDAAYEYLGARGMISDPNRVLTEEVLEKYRDRMISREVQAVGEQASEAGPGEDAAQTAVIWAFDMSGTKLAEEYLTYPEKACLLLTSSQEDGGRIGQFLDYLFAEEG